MSNSLKPKLSFVPLLFVLFFAISLVIVIFTWSHYDQQKIHAYQTLTQSIQTQKNYLDNLVKSVFKLNNQRARNDRLKAVIQQTQLVWQQEIKNNENLSLHLYRLTENPNDESKSKLTVLSEGRLLQIMPNNWLTNFNIITPETLALVASPIILERTLDAGMADYEITARYRFPSVVEFLKSIFWIVAIAFLAAFIFSWFAIKVWKKRLVKNIELSQQRYEQFVQHANDWLWEVNQHGVVTFCGENTEKILGYKQHEITGRPLVEFLYPKTAEKDRQNLDIYFQNSAHIINTKFHFNSKKGNPVLLRFNAEAIKDNKGKLVSYRGTGTDLTEVMQKQDSMISMTFYDALTQLPNRTKLSSKLDDHLNQVIQRKHLILSALIFIDIDDFKDINDMHGQETGNIVLKEVAERLSKMVNGKEMIYRLAGDQFVILVISPNQTLMNEFKIKLEAFINEVLMTINKPFEIDENNILLTASVGITMIPQDGRSTTELFSHGENALTQAKRNGKNRLCYFDASMRELEMHRKHMIKQIKKAIDFNDFTLHYQLQVNSETEEIYGMEALIRWPNENETNLNPHEFIQLAIESNHIQAIDEWVIKQAAQDLAKFHSATHKIIPVSINLSSKTIENPKLKTLLMKSIEKHHLNPSDMRIEITETGLFKNIEQTIKALQELKQLGFESNIDDFGTGYSSLSYLQQLPVDVLKIDKSFIDGIASNPKDMEICQSIINLGKTLNKKIIAEGVQTVQQKELLKAEGCYIIQGFFYYKPAPINEIINLSFDRKIAKKSGLQLLTTG